MKALLDYIPIIVFFYLYKTADKNNPTHPLLTAIGLTGAESNNHIIVATAGLTFATLVVYGFLFVSQKFRLQKQQIFVLLMTVVFGGLTLALRDDFYIRLKAILINLGFALALFLSPLLRCHHQHGKNSIWHGRDFLYSWQVCMPFLLLCLWGVSIGVNLPPLVTLLS